MRTGAAVTAQYLTQLDRLRSHLLTHMDAEYAEFLMWMIDERVSEIKPCIKGDRKPSDFDYEIDELWADLSHGRNMDKLWYYTRLLELRDRTTQRGAPRNEQRDRLIMNLNEFYPPRIKRKYSGNDFQKTVRMACEIAGLVLPNANPKRGRSVDDAIHRMVIETLKFSCVPAEPTTRFEAAWDWWRTKGIRRGNISL